METALRPMSTSQVLDRTFSLYRTNFLLFAGIAALPPALLMIGQLGVLGAGSFAVLSGHTGLAIAAIATAALAGIGLLRCGSLGTRWQPVHPYTPYRAYTLDIRQAFAKLTS